MDKAFTQWFLSRLEPFRDVTADKIAAERDAMLRQDEHNQNYATFLNQAVFPAVEQFVQVLRAARIMHRVSSWGNQLAIRIHLSWRWGELVISQSHEDAITFEHHITTEGEKRTEDRADDHTHQYDLHDPIPPSVAEQELQFFMSRLAQDLVEDLSPELPPGE